MITNKSILAVGTLALLSSATFVGNAFAADMANRAPQQYYAPAPPQEEFGGWYLRGDIGQTNTKGALYAPAYNDASTISYNQLGHEFTGGTSYGLGVGYQFNSWFRVDVTGEYRSKVHFSGNDFATVNLGGTLGVQPIGDSYSGGYSSWVGMVNAYADLGTWWCITPFVGAGVGFARNEFSGLSDTLTSNFASGLYQANGATKTDLAWAVHAGLAYKASSNLTIELAYRYLDLGTAVTGSGTTYSGFATPGRPFEMRDLTSQDVKLGVRWTCCDLPEAPLPPPPLVRKG